MTEVSAYVVVRLADDTYRLDRLTPPSTGPCALISQVTDRHYTPIGWKLKKLRAMQGAASRLYPSPAEALADTKLFKPGAAKAAVANAARSLR